MDNPLELALLELDELLEPDELLELDELLVLDELLELEELLELDELLVDEPAVPLPPQPTSAARTMQVNAGA